MDALSQRSVERDDSVRAAALASSIAWFLGDMSLCELQLVDAEVMKIRRNRRGERDASPIDTRLKAALVELRESTPIVPGALMDFEMPEGDADV